MDDRTAAIIEELRAENKRLKAELGRMNERIESLERENRQLREQLEKAQGAALRQAGPFRRDERGKVPPEQQKPPGRKPGHPGRYRQEPAQIDETVEVCLNKVHGLTMRKTCDCLLYLGGLRITEGGSDAVCL